MGPSRRVGVHPFTKEAYMRSWTQAAVGNSPEIESGRRLLRHVLLVWFMAAPWVAFPSAAVAQDRSGFWFGLGGGYGSANVSLVSCSDTSRLPDCSGRERETSGVGFLRGGWN